MTRLRQGTTLSVIYIVAAFATCPIVGFGQSAWGWWHYEKPRAKSKPVGGVEDISIVHLAVKVDHFLAFSQIVAQLLSHEATRGYKAVLTIPTAGVREVLQGLSGHYYVETGTAMLRRAIEADMTWRILHNVCHLADLDIQGGRATSVDELISNGKRVPVVKNLTKKVHGDPGPLVGFEIATRVAPLQKGDKRISDSGDNPDDLDNRLPPLKGFVPFLLGFAGALWGWINMKDERFLPASAIVFCVSLVAICCGCWTLLPWCAR